MSHFFPLHPLAYPAPLTALIGKRIPGIPFLLERQKLIRLALNRGDYETASFIADKILDDVRA